MLLLGNMRVKWYLIEETKSLASLINNRENNLQLLSLEFGDLLQKNKCTNTIETQPTFQWFQIISKI